MKKILIIAIFVTIIIIGLISDESSQITTPSEDSTTYDSPDFRSFLKSLELPSARSFNMGFTSQPYDFNEQAYQYTYKKVAAHGDFLAFHLDVGVPWPEALEGKDNYHPNLLEIVRNYQSEYRSTQVRYVSTSAQAHNRVSLAPLWAEEDNTELPTTWKNKTFDDPDVIKAYLNWCRFLLKTFKPQYFNYGIEVNYGFSGTEDKRYIAYLKLLSSIYPKLKSEFPSVVILLEFVDNSFETSKENVIKMAREMLKYSDIIGISTYPYVYYADPDQIPASWLHELADMDRNKSIAITETGYIAETMKLSSIGISSPGSASLQMRYTQKLLKTLNELNTDFVIWWEIRDIDQAASAYTAAGVDSLAISIWKDIGFYDSAGIPRPALRVWDKWLQLPREKNRHDSPTSTN